MMILLNATLVMVGVLATLAFIVSLVLTSTHFVDDDNMKARFWLLPTFVNLGLLTFCFSVVAQLAGGK